MSTYSNWLQPALQNLLQRVVRFFLPRSSCTTTHISVDVQRITLNASCMTISGGRTKQLDICCHVTGFMGDFLSFIVVELIRFFHFNSLISPVLYPFSIQSWQKHNSNWLAYTFWIATDRRFRTRFVEKWPRLDTLTLLWLRWKRRRSYKNTLCCHVMSIGWTNEWISYSVNERATGWLAGRKERKNERMKIVNTENNSLVI